jgi:HD-GYP domain-containing protein (c-di-GMP phosphodiesterase class II)
LDGEWRKGNCRIKPYKIGYDISGLLHDVGKIAIPAEILSKPGTLTAAEYDIMKTHPRIGYNILKQIEWSFPIADIVLQHHERMDGSGYDQKLHGSDIMLEARILAVVDVVEAMLSHRPYRPAHSMAETIDEIEKHKGVLYDAKIADICLRMLKCGEIDLDSAL